VRFGRGARFKGKIESTARWKLSKPEWLWLIGGTKLHEPDLAAGLLRRVGCGVLRADTDLTDGKSGN
jgi:hypothetical protein